MNRALAMQPDDEMIPGRDDLDELSRVDPGFAGIAFPIDPRNFIKPDGSYDVSELNVDPVSAETTREHIRKLREATPCAIYPNREGEPL